ncbi:hypothetical protein J2S78_002839 [Salibacterium salarium]|nr:hypothetical protein [Salibacterium salarium]
MNNVKESGHVRKIDRLSHALFTVLMNGREGVFCYVEKREETG